MKTLTLILAIFSLNVLADVNDSEIQKTPCPFANQSANRKAKVVEAPPADNSTIIETNVGKGQ